MDDGWYGYCYWEGDGAHQSILDEVPGTPSAGIASILSTGVLTADFTKDTGEPIEIIIWRVYV